MDPGSSSPYTKEPASGLYLEPDEFSTRTPILLLIDCYIADGPRQHSDVLVPHPVDDRSVLSDSVCIVQSFSFPCVPRFSTPKLSKCVFGTFYV
jgi:hypothetical protein